MGIQYGIRMKFENIMRFPLYFENIVRCFLEKNMQTLEKFLDNFLKIFVIFEKSEKIWVFYGNSEETKDTCKILGNV